jgi:hypothetical protein
MYVRHCHGLSFLLGCFCPSGTVELDDKCVAPDECPAVSTTALPVLPDETSDIDCPEGMVYDKCGSACPTTCANKDVLVRPCTLQCVPGNNEYIDPGQNVNN